MKKNNKELKKTTKKVMAALLAVTMMGSTFAGCSAKKNDSTVEKKPAYLEGTLLENGAVLYVDDDPIIVRNLGSARTSKEIKHCIKQHYEDIITGEIYCVANSSSEDLENAIRKHDPDFNDCSTVSEARKKLICLKTLAPSYLTDEVETKSLTSALTREDLEKIKAGNFTDEDAIEIQERLNESKTETKTLS